MSFPFPKQPQRSYKTDLDFGIVFEGKNPSYNWRNTVHSQTNGNVAGDRIHFQKKQISHFAFVAPFLVGFFSVYL